MAQNNNEPLDMLLVGAGIMSATLATLIKELDPNIRIEIVELHEEGAVESSFPWNNAGTGHAALCELNYTPQAADGSISLKKAININTQFEESKQLWAYLVDKGAFDSPKSFINAVPHMSFVRGSAGVAFLKSRFEALKQHHAFGGMEYTEDRATIAEWAPLLIPGRAADEPLAMTRAVEGSDVNFGALTRQMLSFLQSKPDVSIHYNQKVVGIKRAGQLWNVETKDQKTGTRRNIISKFVFLGAGGGALPLLQMSDIPESKGFGGFPVSGQWLRCDNPEIVAQHQAKVYSQAEVGSPPMSVPHLDTRVVDGKKSLLFGPYAGFTTKFLKYGSFLDLPLSVRLNNIGPMLAVARDNMDLTRYLIKEVRQSEAQRLETLRAFYPEARAEDWKLAIAGQRVQIIKKDPKKGGVLQFGTELVSAQDGSLAALLGASPGASVAVSIILTLIERCFADRLEKESWSQKLAEIFPARASELSTNAERYHQIQAYTHERLQLDLPVSQA